MYNTTKKSWEGKQSLCSPYNSLAWLFVALMFLIFLSMSLTPFLSFIFISSCSKCIKITFTMESWCVHITHLNSLYLPFPSFCLSSLSLSVRRGALLCLTCRSLSLPPCSLSPFLSFSIWLSAPLSVSFSFSLSFLFLINHQLVLKSNALHYVLVCQAIVRHFDSCFTLVLFFN